MVVLLLSLFRILIRQLSTGLVFGGVLFSQLALLPSLGFSQNARTGGELNGAVKGKSRHSFHVRGKVCNMANPKEQVPFAHGQDLLSGQHFLADGQGNFDISSDQPITRLTFKSDLHATQTVEVNDASEITVLMARVLPWPQNQETEAGTKELVQQLVFAKKRNDPDRVGHYQHQVYHKLSVRTDSLAEITQLINAGFRIFGKPLLDTKSPFHYLFLTETTSRKYYQTNGKQKELIDGLRVSGIQQFGGNLPLAQLQAFSVYANYVALQGVDYIGPLAGEPTSRYVFEVRDTIPVSDDVIYLLRFYPKKGQQVSTMRGYLFVSARDYGIYHAIFQPGLITGVQSILTQTYRRVIMDGKSRWAPATYQATLYKPEAVGNVPIEIVQEGYVTAFTSLDKQTTEVVLPYDQTKENWRYDGIIVEPVTGASLRDSVFWIGHRPMSLSAPEVNTYRFYAKVGSLKSVDRLLNIGEQLYYGQLGYQDWAIDLNRVFTFNYYESLRLGLGLTRYWFDHRLTTSGYVGYGFQDKAYKYGLSGSYVLDSTYDVRIGYQYFDDLVEPGQPKFFREETISSAERLRKYQIPRFDIEVQHQGAASVSLWPNLGFQAAYNFRFIRPLYDYSFNAQGIEGLAPTPLSSFTTNEAVLGFKWTIGERFIRLRRNLVSIGSKWPSLYVNYTYGIVNAAGQQTPYRRYDLKSQYQFKAPGWGSTRLSLLAGRIVGNVPYSLLWTGKPSYQDASAVITNSFETMRYNEFLADEYLAFFGIHSFDPIEIDGFPYYPYISLMHNMGWGSLQHGEFHGQVNKASWAQGFYESGLFFNDVFVFNLGGLRTGLGIGGFGRYGATARPAFWDNAVFKFALRFGT